MSRAALEHIEHLAGTIGPRGSCTPAEGRAAAYCRAVFESAGYAVHVQEFGAPRSGWAPFSIAAALMLASVAASHLFPAGGGRTVSALAAAVVTASILLQLVFRPNPLAWLVPAGRSQNVYAVAPARGVRRARVVVSGHVDTHRTPVAMASPFAFRLFQGLTTLGVVAFVALAVWLAVRAARPETALMPLVLLPGAVVAVVLVVTLQPEFSPFVPGANDNASGAAAVLSLAERLKREPLEGTEVWLLASGAEEVGATGPVRLLGRHPELLDASWLILDTIAGAGTGPCLITAEHVLFPLRADPRLLSLGREVARARPDLGAYEHYYRGLFSEHSPLAVAGCRSLAIINFTRGGVLPHWHRPSDTVAGIDPGVLDRTETFVWELLRRIDRPEPADPAAPTS